MKNAAEFEKTLADPQYLENVFASATRLSTFYKTEMGLSEFEKEADAHKDDHRALFNVVNQFFDEEKVGKILRNEQETFKATSTYSSQFLGFSSPSHSALVVARTRHFLTLLIGFDPYMLHVAKRRKDGDTKSISFTGAPAVIKVLSGELCVRVWALTPFEANTDLAAYSADAKPGAPFLLQAGDSFETGDFESIEYLPHDKSAVALFTQMMVGQAPVAVTCDVDSGKLRSTHAVGQEPSRLQMLSTLVRIMRPEGAFDVVANLLDDKVHFIRWHAMRELIGLDVERALPRLRHMVDHDPNPAVRRSASAALEMIMREMKLDIAA